MTKLRHYDNLGTARFITFSCYRRYPVLRQDLVLSLVVEQLAAIRKEHNIKLLGYVLMPEHVHLVLHPPDGVRLGVVIGQMKARAALAILAAWSDRGLVAPQQLVVANGGRRKHSIWQRRCYDHNCRTPETVREKINYCHNNPVTRKLVSEPGDWRWSSYRWYAGERDVPISIDAITPP